MSYVYEQVGDGIRVPLGSGGLALVLGSGACLPDDLEAFDALGVEPDMVVAANRAAFEYGGLVDHWVSQTPDRFPGWTEAHPECADATTWGPRLIADAGPVDRTFEPWGANGSSGFLALQVAFEAGAERAVLCGVPMDDRPHLGSTRPWDAADIHWWAWGQLDLPMARIRSLSGRTRDYFGAPTAAWLEGGG